MTDSSPEEFEYLDRCPLCAAPPQCYRVVTRRGDRFDGERAVLCARCGLIFLNPRLCPDALARYYKSDTFSREVRGTVRPTMDGLAYRNMRARRRWALLRDALPSQGRVLEVGCGAGNFLEILRDAGYDATGIDPSPGFALQGRSRGLNVHVGHFPDDLPSGPDPEDGNWDIILMFHVLEHVSGTTAMLAELRARVAPGGVFILEYPDIELAARRLFLPPTYFERQHLFDFSQATVGAFLARAGFMVRDTVFEAREKPYDRNVLLVCQPTAPVEVDPVRPDEAEALRRKLRRRLAITMPFLPLRPPFQMVKRWLGLYGGMR